MKATRDAVNDILPQAGENHSNIVALDADLGGATKIKAFGQKYPDRYFQVGIAEANMISIASGMSEYGLKVFLASFSAFLTGRYDIIRCSICYPNQPVVLVGSHVGMAIGKDGVTQMGLEDVSIMRALPNMNILNPCNYTQACKVIEYLCDTELTQPHYLRIGRTPVEDFDIDFEFNKGVIVRPGKDVTLFSTGCILSDVLEASYIIERNTNLSVRVVDFSTLKPIDKKLIYKCATETDHLFTVEDHSIVGGLGSIVSEVLCETYPAKLHRIGLNDQFPESGPPADLYSKYGLNAEGIANSVCSNIS